MRKGRLDPYMMHDDGRIPTRVCLRSTMGEIDRTIDVTDGADSFADLLLPEHLLKALAAAGFTKPSPVQTTAIPLARVGADLTVQAKSGTGKTLVYGIPCVEKAALEEALPQACSARDACIAKEVLCPCAQRRSNGGMRHHAVESAITQYDALCQHRMSSSWPMHYHKFLAACCLLLVAAVPRLGYKTAHAVLQALILTPTREIALQVAAVLRALAAESPGLVVGTLIGGLPIEDDQKLLRRCSHIGWLTWVDTQRHDRNGQGVIN